MEGCTLPTAIFFDWDGTLVDSFNFILSCHQHTRKNLGIKGEFTTKDFEYYFGMQRDEILDGIYGDLRPEGQVLYEKFVQENHTSSLNTMPGAEELLKLIQEMGIVCGVVSNKKRTFIDPEITHFGWDEYFSVTIGAGDAKRDKPFADPLLLALDESGLEPHPTDIWYVGDTKIDLECAQEAKCGSIIVTEDIEILDNPYPLLLVENCLQLHEFLLQCAQNQLKESK